jgi:exonuclease SbcD
MLKKSTACKSIIITGGNHDSPGTLNAPKIFLNALSIKKYLEKQLVKN